MVVKGFARKRTLAISGSVIFMPFKLKYIATTINTLIIRTF